jgi:hypothetical protein
MDEGNANAVLLGPLLTDPARLRRVAVGRRKPFDEKSVAGDAVPELEAKGWGSGLL